MKIYQVLNDDGYEFCHPADDNEVMTVPRLCNGTPRAASWTPLEMQLHREDEGKWLSEADSPWMSSNVLILRPRAIAALRPILLEYGELLPLHCAGAELWLYNVTRVIDALDEAASTIDRLPDGRIILVRRPAFRKEAIGDTEVFKPSHRRGESIFVGQRFADLWHSAGLTGVEFMHVWSG
jgi:hypothetical protein